MPPPPAPISALSISSSSTALGMHRSLAAGDDNTAKGPPNPDFFVAPMYNRACVKITPGADRRPRLEHALEELADAMGDAPTLPHDQVAAAQHSGLAVDLPTEHCAFKNCSW